MTIKSKMIMPNLWMGLFSILSTHAADLNVPADYTSIQAAVNAAASGDTIYIAAGIYEGQILILRKNLTLVGETGATIKAKKGMNVGFPNYALSTPLLGIGSSEVVIKDLIFDGGRLQDAYPNYGLVGVFYVGSSGRLEDCTVKGFSDARGPDAWRTGGFGVSVANPAELNRPEQQIQISRNTFEDNGLSIWVTGAWGELSDVRMRFTIQENTILGAGPSKDNQQIGILISQGATGSVGGNHISGFCFTGPDPATDGGILHLDWSVFNGGTTLINMSPVRYETNVFFNNRRSLVSVKSNGSQFVNNTFVGLGNAHPSDGLWVSGSNPLLQTNDFSKLHRGVVLLGNDPVYKLMLGRASQPQVRANQFCDVDQPIETEPMVDNVIEQDTVICPNPALDIAPAVVLSWPGDRTDWILESAVDTQGPWSTVVATPITDNGSCTVTLKTQAQSQFFRLHKP
jgi:hypothetical protein